MTAQQIQILEKVDELMSEHFDAYQMSAQILDVDRTQPGDGYFHQYNGPMSCILGMLDMHKINIAKMYVSGGDE